MRRFKSSHSSAQARIFSRLARGSIGGGFEVSIGGKGGSFGALSTVVGATGGAALGAGEVAAAGGGGGACGFAPGFDGADF